MQDTLKFAAEAFDRADYAEAERLSRQALNQMPTSAARVLLGKVLLVRGDTMSAQQQFMDVVHSDPGCAEAWLNWSKLLETNGHLDKAEECLRMGLRHSPNSHALHNDVALVFLKREKLDDALTHLHRALELDPVSVTSLFNLGAVHRRRRDARGAEAAYREIVRLNPSLAEGFGNLGDILKESDPAGAEAALRTALRLRPNYPEAHDNLGVVLFFKGKLEESLTHFQRAVEANPHFVRAFGHRTTTLFMLNRLDQAWPFHRRRFDVAGMKVDPHGRFPNKVWEGEALHGKSLLIWTEQGLGEEIMQASMFSDALEHASRVTVECSPRILSLFQRSFPQITFISRNNPSRACPISIDADFQIAGGDMGGVFRKSWGDFPTRAAYLVPDVAHVTRLRQRYAELGPGPVVGISWASKRAGTGTHKTMLLADFAPILSKPGAIFVSLQYDADQAEIADVEKMLGIKIFVDTTVDLLGDMDGVAAQVAAMDLVISVSNTTVHVAGALNVPVWNILPGHNASGMWHWFAGRDTSPWYPAMRIYRRNEKDNTVFMKKMADDFEVWMTHISTSRRRP